MSEHSDVRLLSAVVERYDETGEPVTPSQVADGVDENESVLCSRFEALESNYLLATAGGGYRPTVTARELLELDFDQNSMLIIESDPGE